MSSVLEYYGQYNPESTFDWTGLKSSKFGRTRRHFTPRDTLNSSNNTHNDRFINAINSQHLGYETFRVKTKSIEAIP